MFFLRIPKSKGNGQPAAPPPVDPDEMLMDAHTYRDLEVFEGDGGAASLYDLFSGTRTIGGAKVLKGRMKKPWSNAARIRAVQESIEFILEHRRPFDRLPTDVVTIELEKYLSAGLPLVTTENRFEFFMGALDVRFSDFRTWAQMVGGVRRASRMIQQLRAVVAGLPARGRGEIGLLLDELRVHLGRPGFAMVPDKEKWELPAFVTIKVDRMFRFKERAAVDRILELLYQLDALVAMADATEKFGFVIPELAAGPLHVVADGVFNPFVQNPVANPLRLDQRRRMLFLTGPNMAGKTTYLRSCGTALYLAHLGMGVPARAFRFSPCESLFSSITVTDNVRGGVSFFRAEALRVKAIAEAVTTGRQVIAVMDEPFKGTNVKDALDASLAVLERLASRTGSLFLVSSHLIELGERMEATGQVDCRLFEASENEGKLRFDYVLRDGVSTQRLGMRVLREEGIFELLDAPDLNASSSTR